MKTVFDGKQWILETLLKGGIKSVINGSVYKDRRISGSKLEDAVINDVNMDDRYLQDGVFNVNIYVPFLSVKIGETTQYQPDHARLKAIAAAVYPMLHNIWGDGFNLTVVGHKSFEEPAEKANYINFRINLKAFNT